MATQDNTTKTESSDQAQEHPKQSDNDIYVLHASEAVDNARSILNYLIGVSPCEGSDPRDYGLYLILCQAHDQLREASSGLSKAMGG